MAKSTERTINEIKFRMRRSKRAATRSAPGSNAAPIGRPAWSRGPQDFLECELCS